jgi:outer membrane protein assembly factor BamB
MNLRPLVLLCCALCISTACGADWPQWRGPERTGVSNETGLLKSWPEKGPKLLWTFKNAGEGFSSFAVVGPTLYTLGTRDGNEIIIALDVAKGTELWSATIGPIFKALGNWGHGPRSTPTIDDDRLYALGSQGDLVCVDITNKGKEIWRKNFQKDFGGDLMDETGNWGYSESPLIDGPYLICTPGGDQGTLAALNKKDGTVVWRSKELTNKAPDSSLMPAVIHGVRQYIQNSYKNGVGGFISGVAAQDGKVLWTMPIFKGPSYDVAPTPLVKDNLVYMTTYNPRTGCHCFELDKNFKAKELYSSDNQKVLKNNHGGVVLIGDHVYGHSDKSRWVCQDLKTGDQAWETEEFLSTITGSITAADGRLYLFTQDGEVGLVEANPKEFKAISSFKLPEASKIPKTILTSQSSRAWTHPVVSGGRLYVRDHDLVFSFDVKSK